MHGGEPKYYHAVVGGNFRLDEIQAAVLREAQASRRLDPRRQRNAAHYDRAFAGGRDHRPGRHADARPGYRHIYNQYVIRVPDRDGCARTWRARRRHGDLLSGAAARAAVLRLPRPRARGFPESARAARETLALPIYPELTEAQPHFVVDTVTGFYRKQ